MSMKRTLVTQFTLIPFAMPPLVAQWLASLAIGSVITRSMILTEIGGFWRVGGKPASVPQAVSPPVVQTRC